jgi:hypothetical protein
MEKALKEKGYALCEKTRELKDDLEKGFLVLGKNLHKIKTEEMYLCQWLTWEDYLDDMKLSQATASKLITIYEKFILEWKIDQQLLVDVGGWSNAYTLIPLLKGKGEEEIKHSIKELSLLSRSSLDQRRLEAKTGISQDTCLHTGATYTLIICKTCGKKIKQNDD